MHKSMRSARVAATFGGTGTTIVVPIGTRVGAQKVLQLRVVPTSIGGGSAITYSTWVSSLAADVIGSPGTVFADEDRAATNGLSVYPPEEQVVKLPLDGDFFVAARGVGAGTTVSDEVFFYVHIELSAARAAAFTVEVVFEDHGPTSIARATTAVVA